MFASGPNYSKLKTNLRLAINRLKLLEKKKTELALKARKEIADYITIGKIERAKIRVEHIIREDYLVEAMEVTEMYCDLLLARFGLIQQMKDIDEGLAEAISSLIWVAPRLQTDVVELKIISDQLALKYAKPYAQACREQQVSTISEKLIHKLSVQAPPKLLVEKYLMEIAKNYNLEYEPDPQVLQEADYGEDPLISLDDERNNLGNGGGASGGSGGGAAQMNIPPSGFTYPQQPVLPDPFNYPMKPSLPDSFNLPNVPGPANYKSPPKLPVGPPPHDPCADTMPPIAQNAPQQPPTYGGPSPSWEDIIGNPAPPPYSSMDNTFHPPAIIPAPFLPPQNPPLKPQRQNFPPDMHSTGGTNLKDNEEPKPAPRFKFSPSETGDIGAGTTDFNLPDLPCVPDQPSVPHNDTKANTDMQDDIDFDDLNKRFEQLKKKK